MPAPAISEIPANFYFGYHIGQTSFGTFMHLRQGRGRGHLSKKNGR